MDKQVIVISTMEYYSAMKRREVLTHATICMNLENIMQVKKPVTTDHIMYGSINVKYSE